MASGAGAGAVPPCEARPLPWTGVVCVPSVGFPVNDGTPSGAPATVVEAGAVGWKGCDVGPATGAGDEAGMGDGGPDVVTARDFDVGLSRSTEKGVLTPVVEPDPDPDRSGTMA